MYYRRGITPFGLTAMGEAESVGFVSALVCHGSGPKGVTPRYQAAGLKINKKSLS